MLNTPTCTIGKSHTLLQMLDALTTMSRAISHDYNNLLNAISGNLFLVKHICETDNSACNSIKQIENCTSHAIELTSKIKTFTGNTKVETSDFLINKLIKDKCKKICLPHINMQDIILDFDSANPKINSDKNLIATILESLVTNAMEAMIERTGQITISTELVTANRANDIALTYPETLIPQDYICITVKDDGKGITLKNQKKIFNPFFTTKIRGEGLGLSIVFGIIKALNGGIIVNSKASRGSTFSVLIPVKG